MNNRQTPPEPRTAQRDADTRLILEAVDYLDQCRTSGSSVAVLVSPERELWHEALARFLSARPAGSAVVRLPAPTDSNHVFLEAVLVQLGFDPFESTADDLLRLLTVVLRQHTGDAHGPVILLEDAQSFGPRVFETLRELVRAVRDLPHRPLLVLAGHAGLHRVLESPGMATVRELTRKRFDFQAARTASASATDSAASHPGTTHAVLTLSLNNDIEREIPFAGDRLLIGRGPHSDIRIGSRFVSRQHALLIRNADGDWLLDLKSTNGTVVNSRLVHQRRLRHGDVIAIGNHRLLYSNPAAAAAGSGMEVDPPNAFGETVVMRSLEALLGAGASEGRPSPPVKSSAA